MANGYFWVEVLMNRNHRLTFFALLGWLTLIAGCVVLARSIETNFGTVRVQIVHLQDRRPAGSGAFVHGASSSR